MSTTDEANVTAKLPRRPHPRAPISGRLSASEFRAMMGRNVGATRKGSRGQLDLERSLVKSGHVSAELSELPLRFVLPFIPPSVNALFTTVNDRRTGRTKRVLTTKARKTRKAIAEFVTGRLSEEQILELHISVELPCLTKAGKLRKVDVSNRVKFLEDCIADCLGIDDRQFFRVVLNKLHADHERTVVEIREFQNTQSDE